MKSVEDCWKNVCLRDVDKLILHTNQTEGR